MTGQHVHSIRRVAASGAVLLGIGLSLTGQIHRPGSDARVLGEKLAGNGKDSGGGNDKKDFTIAGQVTGLYPGATRPLVLTLTNANNFAIRVSTLTVRVAHLSGCAGANLEVAPYPAGSVVIPGNGTATTTLGVHMAADPPDACKDRTFDLTYSGTAVKV
jgi:hypothetical protein